MKRLFFPRLALSGIRKNRKLYVPYLISCVGMVMMYYLVQSLSQSSVIRDTKGGDNILLVLSLGRFVIAAFALLFLFYTNSFLVRRRYKEFGLFNILGMDKRGISRVIFWESLTIAAVGLGGGIALGIVFSKFAELGLLRAVHSEVDFRFTVSGTAVLWTLLIFGIIFLLLLFKSLWQVRKCRPLELLRSDTVGEKPPKANFVWALLGLLILGAAYYIALSIQSPLTALLLFFVAVLMVILATYLLFMAGSVALCKLLQKNKKYYYQKRHFVSVSSMAYRMKRNGAGLASICILATMVLVMLSSTASLYFGAEDALQARYPRDCEITLEFDSTEHLSDDAIRRIRSIYTDTFEKERFSPQNIDEYRYAAITGMFRNGVINPFAEEEAGAVLNFDDLRTLYFVRQDDYNAATGSNVSLSGAQAMVYPLRCNMVGDTLTVDRFTLSVVGRLDRTVEIGSANVNLSPALIVVVSDFSVLQPLEALRDASDNALLSCGYHYGYDSAADEPTTVAAFHAQEDALTQLIEQDKWEGYACTSGCKALERDDFFGTFGGMFFLGILLSVVFIFAAAMIIYYKQVSEGYEDQSRFAIMQKVGMTRQDIKKSINSQILTVFFAPLLLAGVHLACAFPMIWKILQLFNLRNLPFVLVVTGIAFVCFGLFYALIYKTTAKAYYSIVAPNRENED